MRRPWIWILLLVAIGIAVAGYLMPTRQNVTSRTEPTLPAPTTSEASPGEGPMPETTEPEPESVASGTTRSSPTTGSVRPRVRQRQRRPRPSATSPFATTQPQPTSQAYVPGDAYVPPTTPASPPGQPGAGGATSARLLFTGDGKLLVVASSGAVESCDPVSGQRRAIGASIGDAHAMTVSPDGRTIATHDAGGVVHLFDAATWIAQTTTYTPGVEGVIAIAMSPDGRTLALAGKGVVIWDLLDKKPRTTLHANDACTSVSFSADGKFLAVATAEGATLWETTLWQKEITLNAGGWAKIVRFWRARSALATTAADQTIRIYDLATRQVQTTLNAGAEIGDFTVSSDGRTVAATDANGAITVWDSATGVARKLP